jgi:hypothetical protein
MAMGYIVGASLAVLVAGFGRVAGLDRERAFYSTVLVVVASYYVLFAVIGGSTHALVLESIGLGGFAVLAAAGFKHSAWIVVAGLAGHGVFDYFHADVVSNPGVPEWWPAFCLAYDVGAAVLLAVAERARAGRLKPAPTYVAGGLQARLTALPLLLR